MKTFLLALALTIPASVLACEGGSFDGDISIIKEHLNKQLDCRHANMRVPGTLTLSTARCLGARPQVTLKAGGISYDVFNVDEDFIRGIARNGYKFKLTFTVAQRRNPVSCFAPLNR